MNVVGYSLAEFVELQCFWWESRWFKKHLLIILYHGSGTFLTILSWSPQFTLLGKKKARCVMISTPTCSHCLLDCDNSISHSNVACYSCVVINLPCNKEKKKEFFWIQEKHQKLEPNSHVLSLMNLINQQNGATTTKI